jgi:uncharacterized domain 1
MNEWHELLRSYGGFKKFFNHLKDSNINLVNYFNEEILTKEELYKFIGLKFIEIKEGNVIATFPAKKELLRRGGMVNGGIIMAIADVVIGVSVMTLSDGIDQFTAELKVNFLEPLKDGPFTCIGKVIRIGRTLAVGEAEILDNNKKLCSKALGTWYIVK